MKKIAVAGSLFALLLAASVLQAEDTPKPAEPSKEHAWLQQLVGEWEGDVGKCSENARMLGGLWLVSDVKVTFGDVSMTAVQTLGYDPRTKKYVGTWIDSIFPHLWTYDGTMDASGKILTLEAEGPNPAAGGKISKMRDVIELKSKDHKVLTSQILGDDGKWQTFQTVNYKRKK